MPYVGSTKSLSGHALGAAGVHEAIYSLLMMRDEFLAESVCINRIYSYCICIYIVYLYTCTYIGLTRLHMCIYSIYLDVHI